MSNYVIGQSLYQGGKLVEVVIQCLDAPEPPDYHLYEAYLSEPGDVVGLIRTGAQVFVWWPEPVGKTAVEVITFADGTESIEVAQQGQPVGYRSLANLPESDA